MGVMGGGRLASCDSLRFCDCLGINGEEKWSRVCCATTSQFFGGYSSVGLHMRGGADSSSLVFEMRAETNPDAVCSWRGYMILAG